MKLNLGDFLGRPNMSGGVEAIECVDGVCKLPGGGEVKLGSPFILEKDGKKYIVSTVVLAGYIMYHTEEM